MVLKIIVSFLIITLSQGLKAQSIDKLDKNKNEKSSHNHKNEIGIANSPIYLIKEKSFGYGLHVHFIRNIKESNFGLGAGYERIFDEHNHNTLGLVFSYKPIEGLKLSVSPGLKLEDNNISKPEFAMHFETAYEFELKRICIGPVFETAFDPEEIHLSLGLHIGFEF